MDIWEGQYIQFRVRSTAEDGEAGQQNCVADR